MDLNRLASVKLISDNGAEHWKMQTATHREKGEDA